MDTVVCMGVVAYDQKPECAQAVLIEFDTLAAAVSDGRREHIAGTHWLRQQLLQLDIDVDK